MEWISLSIGKLGQYPGLSSTAWIFYSWRACPHNNLLTKRGTVNNGYPVSILRDRGLIFHSDCSINDRLEEKTAGWTKHRLNWWRDWQIKTSSHVLRGRLGWLQRIKPDSICLPAKHLTLTTRANIWVRTCTSKTKGCTSHENVMNSNSNTEVCHLNCKSVKRNFKPTWHHTSKVLVWSRPE